MPEPDARLPDVPQLSPEEQDAVAARQKVVKQAHELQDNMTADVENSKTFGGWLRGAQERIRKSDCAARTDLALAAVDNLPAPMRGQWTNRLTMLKNFAARRNRDGSEGDPVAILRFAENIALERETLRKFAQTDATGEVRNAILAIDDAFNAFVQTIGQAPNGVIVRNPFANMQNSPIDRRESHLLRTGIFMAAGVGALATGTLAFLAKDGEANTTLPLTYLLVVGLAAGWGSITERGSDRLQGQINFLVTSGNDWELLQFGREGRPAYGVRGPDWGAFVENWYREGARNPLIAAFLRSGNKQAATAEQRAAILALAPPGIQPQVTAMINSNRGSVPGADLRLMIGLLSQATNPDAQSIVINFVRSGATRQNVQQVAKQNAAPGGGPGNSPIGIAPGSPTLFGPTETGFSPPTAEPTVKEDEAKAAAKKKAEEDRVAEEKTKEAERRKKALDWPADAEGQRKRIMESLEPLFAAGSGANLLTGPVVNYDLIPGRLNMRIGGGGIAVNGRSLELLYNNTTIEGGAISFFMTLRELKITGGELSLEAVDLARIGSKTLLTGREGFAGILLGLLGGDEHRAPSGTETFIFRYAAPGDDKMKADADAKEAARKKAEMEAKPKEDTEKDAAAKKAAADAKEAARIKEDARLKAEAAEAAKKKAEGSDWPTMTESAQQQFVLKRIPGLLQTWSGNSSLPIDVVPGQVTAVITDTGIQLNGRPLNMQLSVTAIGGRNDSAALSMTRAGLASGRLSIGFARTRLLGSDRTIPVSQIAHDVLATIIVGTLRGREVGFNPPRNTWPLGVTALRIGVSRT